MESFVRQLSPFSKTNQIVWSNLTLKYAKFANKDTWSTLTENAFSTSSLQFVPTTHAKSVQIPTAHAMTVPIASTWSTGPVSSKLAIFQTVSYVRTVRPAKLVSQATQPIMWAQVILPNAKRSDKRGVMLPLASNAFHRKAVEDVRLLMRLFLSSMEIKRFIFANRSLVRTTSQIARDVQKATISFTNSIRSSVLQAYVLLGTQTSRENAFWRRVCLWAGYSVAFPTASNATWRTTVMTALLAIEWPNMVPAKR